MDFHLYNRLSNGMNNNAATKAYVVGFVLSMLLTCAAYFLVVNHLLNGGVLIAAIIGLALVQLAVQLIFFLNLGQESKPRWKLAVFLSTVSIILTIVIGSLWIMNNLNYSHMRTPAETDTYILHEEGIHK